MARRPPAVVAVVSAVLCLAALTPAPQAQRLSLDAVLAAYRGGDHDVIKRTFVRSPDFQQRLWLGRPRDLDRWLGSWDRAKALLLLELARVGVAVAPQYIGSIASAGRRYLDRARETDQGTDRAEFVRLWHRSMIAVLQVATDPVNVELHAEDSARANGGPDARVLLTRGIARERRCWSERPELSQASNAIDALLAKAGMRVPDDPGGPLRSDFDAAAARHRGCLRAALTSFEAAAAAPDAADEARVRGGWLLIQDGRYDEAIAWLQAASPRDDRELQYWHALFRGRALTAARRPDDAVHAYRSALVLFPGAQSAGLGLTIALTQLDRIADADEVARSVRAAGGQTPDPWLIYLLGDDRFVGRWTESLRRLIR